MLFPALSSPANQGYYMQPALRGDTLVFVSQGDLWAVSAKGGLAHALTGHTAPASSPSISPDGKTVAFSGTYEGPREAYTMSLDGGLPTRLTYGGGMTVAGWSPDGKVLATTYARSGLPNVQMVRIDPQTRAQTLVPLAQVSDGAYDATGKTLFFTRLPFQGSQTRRYAGGYVQRLWKYVDGAPEATELTKDYAGTSKEPAVWKGRVYFLSDRDGTMNVWSMDENGGGLKQVTKSKDWEVQSFSLDAGRIAYQLGADLHLTDLATGADQKLDVALDGDFDASRERWIRNPMAYLTNVDASANGDRVVLTARGQVFVAPTEPGRLVEATRKPGVRYRNAIFMPDGKSVLALSDQTGETEWWRFPANGVGPGEQLTSGSTVLTMGGTVSPDGKRLASYDKNYELWVVDLTTKTRTKVATSGYGEIADLAWSPDSKALAYVMPTVSFGRLTLYDVATAKSTPVTSVRSAASSPAWTPDGKWLYFLADRTFVSSVGAPWGDRQPEPYFDKQAKVYAVALRKGLRSPFLRADETTVPDKAGTGIDLDGIETRQIEVPIPAGDYRSLSTNGDRLFMVDAPPGGAPSLVAVEVKDREIGPKPVLPGVGSYVLTRDGKKIVAQRGANFLTVAAAGGAPTDVDLSGWSFAVDPKEEWRQMFREAWRLERDYFWDPALSGLDWKAVLAKYQPLADRVRSREELSDVLAQMVSELATLHVFVYGGDLRGPSQSVGIGTLGGEFARDAAMGGYRITRVYQGDPDYPDSLSPLVRPGVDLKVGDAILSVNGVDVLDLPDLAAALRNQANKPVLLHVREAGGAVRDVVARPLGGDGELRYADWEDSRRQKVEGASGGAVGYLHLRAMGAADIAQWERDFYPNFDKQGLIIDVRHNRGGNIDSWIVEKLLRKASFYFQDRVGEPSWNMQWAFRGHIVVLCDQETASDGETFTESVKRLNLGKTIGMRTWGGGIWLSSSNVLADNGIATAAESGVYGPEGKWVIEGHGVEPDVTVDNLPHATFLGGDAQLDAALAYLAKEIKDHPVPVPAPPVRPNKTLPVRGS